MQIIILQAVVQSWNFADFDLLLLLHLLFSFVYLGGRDSPIVNIFSRTIITVFVIDSKPVLTWKTVSWKPQNARWRHTGDVSWNTSRLYC